MILILIPILGASVVLNIRQLRELSEISVGAILTFAILGIYGPILCFKNDGFTFVKSYDGIDLALGLGLGITSTIV